MLSKLKGKKVKVGVAFADLNLVYKSMFTNCYVGVVESSDDNFLMFEDGSMIGIRFIQTIEIVKD